MFDPNTGIFLATIGQDLEPINAVSWSPDGSKIATGANTLAIWEEPNEQFNSVKLFDLVGHSEAVTGVAWSPDGTELASGSYDGTLRLWDASTGSELNTFSYNSIYDVKWSPTLNQIGIFDGPELLVIEASSGEILDTISGENITIQAFSWQPKGSHLAYKSSNDAQNVLEIISAPSVTITPISTITSTTTLTTTNTFLPTVTTSLTFTSSPTSTPPAHSLARSAP